MENFIESLFRSPEEKLKEAQENSLKRRQSAKDNLAKNLKEKLFFKDEEVEIIHKIVDDYMAKMDLFAEKADYSKFDSDISNNMQDKLASLREEMMSEIHGKIKEIMAAKVARAKEYFGKK